MMQAIIRTYLLILISIIFQPFTNRACTNFLVAKGATVDGSTMISYAADSHIRYGELYFSPATHWPEGSMVTIYDRGTAEPLGQIPQVSYTYQTVGFMNEHQVAIGESTFGGRSELADTTGLMDYAALMFLATQRAKTAREAIKVIAELVEKYGYASSGESFSIGDPNEVWIMELIGKGTDLQVDSQTGEQFNKNKGAVWVAIRIPDGYISAHANHARITTFPLEEQNRSISSKNLDKIFNPEVEVVYAHDVISFAREQNYFEGDDTAFSFSDMLTYKDDAAFWVFNRVAHFVYLFYNRVMPDVRKVQNELENKFREYTPGVDAAALNLWENDPELAREFLTDYSCNMGIYTVRRWKELGEFLLVKYLDGNKKQEKNGRFLRNDWGYPQPPSFPGYSTKWKEEVIRNTGDRFIYPESE